MLFWEAERPQRSHSTAPDHYGMYPTFLYVRRDSRGGLSALTLSVGRQSARECARGSVSPSAQKRV